MILRLDSEEKLYEEVTDKNKLFKMLEDRLTDYNISNPTKMDLVFFEDAINHICRISRILRQPRGNAMLIGVSGCGK
jgi:dynein heavy chain